MPNLVVYFEIEAQDKNRASKFYSDTFGWEMTIQPELYGGYVSIKTGDSMESADINGEIS